MGETTIKPSLNSYEYHKKYYLEHAVILKERAKKISKDRYHNDEEYKRNKLEKNRKLWQEKRQDPEILKLNRDIIKNKYHTDEEYRKSCIERAKKTLLNRTDEEKEAINAKRRFLYSLGKSMSKNKASQNV